MKPLRFNPTPNQLATLVLLGGLIAACGFLATAFFHRDHRAGLLTMLATTLALIVIGLTVSFKAGTSLESGIANERWRSEQIEALRANLSSFLWTALAGAFLIVGFILMAVTPHQHQLAWVGIVLAQTVTRLQIIAKRPRPSTPGTLTDWHSFAPLRSDQWGQHN